jgi:LysR family transcriptional regulator, hydrogen peroxide-inducible genes activator
MNVTDLSLKDLTYAVALAESLNFRVAAEQCFVSQPALSKQIQLVEQRLGVMLFERDKKRVLLTPHGELFVTQARVVLNEAEQLLVTVAPNDAFLKRPLKLGVIASICPYLFPPLIPALRKRYPDLQLQLDENLTDNLLSRLKTGELDAVIAARTFPEDGLAVFPLYFEPFLLACAKEVHSSKHPALQRELSLKDITPETLLLLEDGHCLKDQTLDLCGIAKHHHPVNLTASSMNTLLQMAALGLGQAILPQLVVETQPFVSETLDVYSFSTPAFGRDVALYCRQSSPFKSQYAEFSDWIRQNLKYPSLQKPSKRQ